MRKSVVMVMFMLLLGTACKQEEQTERNYIIETIEQKEETQETREFDFYTSMIFQNGDTKEVYMNAIINIKEYDLESMFEEVKKAYDIMNGKADKMTLRLYENKKAIKAGNCLGEKIYTE